MTTYARATRAVEDVAHRLGDVAEGVWWRVLPGDECWEAASAEVLVHARLALDPLGEPIGCLVGDRIRDLVHEASLVEVDGDQRVGTTDERFALRHRATGVGVVVWVARTAGAVGVLREALDFDLP